MNKIFSLTIALTLTGVFTSFAQQPYHGCEQCTPRIDAEAHLVDWLAQRGLQFDGVDYRMINGRQVIAVPVVSVVEAEGRYLFCGATIMSVGCSSL